jgi:adenine-specific DNA-methyltransferase
MPELPLARLQALLRDLFQYDYADLDFGIYRLLRLKRGEVEAFLTEQLPRRVDEVFKGAAGEVHAQLERELAELAGRVRQEIDADALAPTGEIKAEYREQRARAARDLIAEYENKRQQVREIQVSEEQKAEVFNHLWAFFSRYYETGDFIPKRRYGARETYAVPYNGEEVFFHWANRDQHYVKTAESLRDYAFTVDMLGKPCRVRFTLTEASLPPGNTKGDTRYFFPLPKEAAWDKDTRTFTLPFHYRLPTETEIEKHGKNSKLQESILQAALPKIIEAVPNAALRVRLSEIVERKEDEETSLLLKRLRHFCRKNTSDYFIHKNLDGFLRRELEFYLKDQVLHLADLDGDLRAKQRTLRVVRQLAEEVIQFLAQIEDVQKRLFEKRKFVLKTDYLVPIQNVPRELWREIIVNDKQLKAWKELFAVEPGRVNEKFLAEHPTLVVNTAHFNAALKERLQVAFADLDEATDGLLIHAENYQALRFLEHKYAGKIKCIYIDPPYNTGSDGFIYKDRYRHSTWLSMILERVGKARAFLMSHGAIFVSVDEIEVSNLQYILDDAIGSENYIATFVWEGGRKNDSRLVSISHDYMLCYAMDKPSLDRAKAEWKIRKEGIDDIYRKAESLKREHGKNQVRISRALEEWLDGLADNHPAKRHKHYSAVDERGVYFPSDIGWHGGDGPKYQVLHPVTRQSCKVPERGWMYPTSERMQEAIAQGLVHFWEDHTRVPCAKAYLKDNEHQVPNSVFYQDRRGASKRLRDMLQRDASGRDKFENPKDERVLARQMTPVLGADGFAFDFFAGSGATAHAVIGMNRDDGAGRRFVLVEMADYFDTVLLPRLQKVMFTPEWKDGEPVRTATKEEAKRTPRLLKVLRLEGYEDALHNLATDQTRERELPRAKAFKEKIGGDACRLTYMARLPLEASASMLNLAKLEHPFAYTIEVLGEDGPRRETVDLVETFNFLYGLHVQRIETWHDDTGKRDYRAVKAKNANGRRVLVLWRDMEKLDPAVEREFLEARLKKDGPFDEAWINGDTATPGVQSLDGVFKRLLEEEER